MNQSLTTELSGVDLSNDWVGKPAFGKEIMKGACIGWIVGTAIAVICSIVIVGTNFFHLEQTPSFLLGMVCGIVFSSIGMLAGAIVFDRD